MRLTFAKSPAATLGIEWELALTNKDTGELSNCAPEIIADLKKLSPRQLAARPTAELLQNTVELVSSPHQTVPAAIAEMQELAALLVQVADAHNVAPIGAGGHPFATWEQQLATDTARYREFMHNYGWWGRNMLIWGIHTHIGIADQNLAIPTLNKLLNYQPHLIALAASSPFWLSDDTSYASNRTMLFQQLPSAGLPPEIATWEDFEAAIADLQRYGIITEVNEARWDIRPAPQWGTLELRACDSVSDLETLGAISALSQCLTAEAASQKHTPPEQMPLPRIICAENKWRASRYGFAAEIITNSQGATAKLGAHLAATCERLLPFAADLGCTKELEYARNRALNCANSSTEQLACYNRQLQQGNDKHTALQEVVRFLQRDFRESVSRA